MMPRTPVGPLTKAVVDRLQQRATMAPAFGYVPGMSQDYPINVVSQAAVQEMESGCCTVLLTVHAYAMANGIDQLSRQADEVLAALCVDSDGRCDLDLSADDWVIITLDTLSPITFAHEQGDARGIVQHAVIGLTFTLRDQRRKDF